jgi:succinate dehydrogenase flavin-adding protein (antitoxin of CptAB toxin-antitoxin module)
MKKNIKKINLSQIKLNSRRGILELDLLLSNFIKKNNNMTLILHHQFVSMLNNDDMYLYKLLININKSKKQYIEKIITYIKNNK